MDPLSNVLALLKPRSYLSAGLEAGGDWSIQFPDQQEGIKCGAVVLGQCWLQVDGAGDPIHLVEGDSFLLPKGLPFRLASDMALVPIDSAAVFSGPCKPGIVVHNGHDFRFVSTRYVLDGSHARMLLQMLPPVVHIRNRSGQASMRWPVEQMMMELASGLPGAELVQEHLAHMMLIRALRLHLADGPSESTGWLYALSNSHLAAAMAAVHDEPAKRWTLDGLAKVAGMSRSSFASKFKTTVGLSAMEYLMHWRMLLASDRLKSTNDPISAIAPAVGYESDASFSMAFKKVMGLAPRQYSRGLQEVPSRRGLARDRMLAKR